MKIPLLSLVLVVFFAGSAAAQLCPEGDLDGDCKVYWEDIKAFAEQWLDAGGCSHSGCADFDGVNGINLYDFSVLAAQWGKSGIPLVINEFMASNNSESDINDPQGDYDDWVEIYNFGDTAIDLGGMYLTDDLNEPTKWQIPNDVPAETTVGAYGYLLIWADRDTDDGPLHADFKLDVDGEQIGLFDTDGSTLIDGITFGEQVANISYGRYPDGVDDWYTMSDPTPEAANTMGTTGKVWFSRLSGTFTDSFLLELSTVSDTATIYYTTNGSIPTDSSTPYTGPITINNSQTRRIRARAYDAVLLPGPVTSHAYLPLDSDVQSFNSNLPVVVLDTFGFDIDTENDPYTYYPYRPVASAFIDTDLTTGRATITDLPDFAGRAGLKVRGDSSASDWMAASWARQYSFETWTEADGEQDKNVSILGFPAESDWILHIPFDDKSLMRNVLAYKWSNVMGNYAVRTKFVELFLNKNGDNVSMSDYWGIYIFMEKIRVDDNRVDIARLEPTDNAEPEISGGYIIKHDKNTLFDETFTTTQNKTGEFQYHDPRSDELTTQQKAWIKGYLDELETALYGGGFTDPVSGYAKYMDVNTFIDFFWIVEMTKQVDSYVFSTYMYKDRNGKLKMGPAWDFNIAFGNAGPTPGQSWYFYWQRETLGWYYVGLGGGGGTNVWYNRLREDAEYNLKCADRWFELRESRFNDANINADLDYYYNLLSAEAAARNFDRWQLYVDPDTGMEVESGGVWASILNAWTWPNWYYGTPNDPHTYQMEVEWTKNWLTGEGTPAPGETYDPDYTDRLGWMDTNIAYAAPPSFYVEGVPMDTGGHADAGDELTMSKGGAPGTIYYTLDGNDPRVWTTSSVYTSTMLVVEGAEKNVLIPSGPISDDWKGGNEPFDDSGWTDGTFIPDKTGGVGYDTGSDYDPFISTDVETEMHNIRVTCYIRVPFTVSSDDLASFNFMTIKVRYDDAYVLYINGTEVKRSDLVPGTLTWNSSATSWRDPESTDFEETDISGFLSELNEGDNILAIHGLNSSSTSTDFLISVELVASQDIPGAPGGGISGSAIEYVGPITLTKSTLVKARVLDGSDWSALNEATFAVGPVADNLRITEIMYHPKDTGDPINDPNAEFIELKNIGPEAINLNLTSFTDGVYFTFPDIDLGPGNYVVVVKDSAVFASRYPSFSGTIAGQYTGRINNAGERIALQDAAGQTILNFHFKDGWYEITDGHGFSLNIIDPNNPDPNSWEYKEYWQASSVLGGSPGADYAANVAPNGAIVINEVLTHTDEPVYGDWIELHNTTGSAINISGWFLSDDDDDLKKYEITSGTSIPGNGYKVFTQVQNFDNPGDPGSHTGFGLDELGETVYLSSGSGGELAGGYSIKEDFKAAENDVTFGRYIKSAASGYDVDFVAMDSPTKESVNSTAKVDPLVINEIMYNPSAVQDELGEFIELKNISGVSQLLYDLANPENTWKFTDGVDFTFPPGITMAVGERLLVVRCNPATFRAVHGSIPPTVQILGPFENDTKLDNGGEKVEISMPGAPEPDGFVPYIRIDRVKYSDGNHPENFHELPADPWPTEADGGGKSLTRTNPELYGNDPNNWQASTPTPGL